MNEAQKIAKLFNIIGQTCIKLINGSKIFPEKINLDKVISKDKTITVSWK